MISEQGHQIEFLPPVADRRSPERRSRRRAPRADGPALEVVGRAVLGVCGGLGLTFVFFVAIGTINLGRALAGTVAAACMLAVWLAGLVYRHRNSERRVVRHERERRGF